MRFAVGARRSRSPQISSLAGFVCPKRRTSSLSTPFFVSAPMTRRTMLRSSDHICNTQRSPSARSENFAVLKSNSTSPFSITSAAGASAMIAFNCSETSW
jgi:hypothetical protein